MNSAFPSRTNLAQKSKFIYDKQIESKCMFAEILRFMQIGERMLHEDEVLPRGIDRAAIFVSTSSKERRNKPFSAINLASQQKTTKLYFSSQVRKQFKLLTVPFKPLRCRLRSDKLVNCNV